MPGLDDVRAVEHDDLVGHTDRREAVRDEDRDAAVVARLARRGREALEQCVLGLRVERGGGLVEHAEQRRVAHEPTSERELLPLPDRQLDAVVPGRSQLGLEPVRHALDDVGRAGATDRGEHRGLVVDVFEVADPDGRERRVLEAEEVLERAGQAIPPLLGVETAEIDAVHGDATLGRLVELAEQLHERGLAGAVLPDEGHHRARPSSRLTFRSTHASVPGYRNETSSKRMPVVMRAGTG